MIEGTSRSIDKITILAIDLSKLGDKVSQKADILLDESDSLTEQVKQFKVNDEVVNVLHYSENNENSNIDGSNEEDITEIDLDNEENNIGFDLEEDKLIS